MIENIFNQRYNSCSIDKKSMIYGVEYMIDVDKRQSWLHESILA